MQVASVTPVVGLPQVNGWSQSIDRKYDGFHIVGTLAVAGDNASSVGRDIVGIILEQELKNAQHLYQFVEYLYSLARGKQCQLFVALGLFSEGRCTLCSIGGTVWLKRGEKVGVLVEAETEIALVQGSSFVDDVFIFATTQTQQFLPTVELQFGQGFDVDGVITSIVPAIHGLQDSSLCAISFINISQKHEVVSQLDAQFASEQEGYEPQTTQTYLEEAQKTSLQPVQSSQYEKGIPLESVKKFFTDLPKLFSSRTYVDQHTHKKSVLWILGLLVVVLLGIGIGIYFVLQARAERTFATELVTPYQTRIADAQKIAERDPTSARMAVEGVVAELMALQTQYSTTGRSSVVEKLDETIAIARTVQTEVSAKQEFADLPIFYDLRLASSGFLTTMSTIQGQRAIFIDSEKKNAVVLDLPTKQVAIVPLSDLAPVVAVSPQSEDSFAVVAEGIYAVPLAQDGQQRVIKEVGDSNRAATFINTFGSYVYVFNPEKRNVYRYTKSEKTDTYSDPIGWLQDPLGVSFESIKSLMIDGDVWFTTDVGEVLKFSAGRRAAFSVSGLSEPFSSAIFLFTQEATTHLYVLEPEKKRLVILSKSGQFIREVRSNSLLSATSVFVSDELQKAFVVSGSIVYEIAL
jgi:hypothetical protein